MRNPVANQDFTDKMRLYFGAKSKQLANFIRFTDATNAQEVPTEEKQVKKPKQKSPDEKYE